MKIQYASDLHLELEENSEFLNGSPLDVAGDILVLAGDTCYLGKERKTHMEFFKWCSENYKETFLLPGNHEYYDQFPIDSTVENWQMDIFPNVHYINNKSVVIGNAELFFSTMWTQLEPVDIYTAERVMTDFKRIALSNGIFRASSQNRIHAICKQWLSRSLNESVARHKIVITHHCPVESHEVKRYVGVMGYPSYSEDMTALMETAKPDYWIHGHIHSHCTNGMKTGATTILTNPLGYVDDNENEGFDGGAIIEI